MVRLFLFCHHRWWDQSFSQVFDALNLNLLRHEQWHINFKFVVYSFCGVAKSSAASVVILMIFEKLAASSKVIKFPKGMHGKFEAIWKMYWGFTVKIFESSNFVRKTGHWEMLRYHWRWNEKKCTTLLRKWSYNNDANSPQYFKKDTVYRVPAHMFAIETKNKLNLLITAMAVKCCYTPSTFQSYQEFYLQMSNFVQKTHITLLQIPNIRKSRFSKDLKNL